MTDTSALGRRLSAAATAVEAANIPADLRSAAFVLAFQERRRQAQPEGDAVELDSTPTSKRNPDSTEAVAKVSTRLEVPKEMLESIYDFSDGVALVVPRRALAPSQRQAMPQVIQLIAAARQAQGSEAWTAAEDLRIACDERGVLDRKNFAAVLEDLNGKGLAVRGKGAKREVKLNAAGFENTTRVVRSLASALG